MNKLVQNVGRHKDCIIYHFDELVNYAGSMKILKRFMNLVQKIKLIINGVGMSDYYHKNVAIN